MKPQFVFIYSERHKIILVLVMLVFFAGLFFIIPTGDILHYPDESNYVRLAESLIGKGAYLRIAGKLTAYKAPGYPLLLSMVFHLWNSPMAAKIINAAALAGTAYLLALIAAEVIPEGSLFASLLVLFYPVYFYTADTLYPQTLGAFLFSAVLFLLIRLPGSRLIYAISGFLFGLLVLMIPVFLLIFPILSTFIFIDKKGDKQCIWIPIFSSLLGFSSSPVREQFEMQSFTGS